MAEKFDNTSKVDTNTTSKPALVTDLNPSYVGDENYTHARNIVRASKEGDLGSLSNEPRNQFCFQAPYKIIGHVQLPDDEVMVFSTDNIRSEIGIGNTLDCSYRKVTDLSCLNFNDKFLIKGVSKKHFGKGTVVTFTDKYNPVRRAEVDKLFDLTNCDDILLFKKIAHPCITVKKGQVGNIPSGMFSVAIAYTVDGQVFSDYYSITNRIALNNISNSLELEIEGLDTEFDEYVVVVVGTYIEPDTESVTKTAKRIGPFSTTVSKVAITDFLNPDYDDVKLEELVQQRRTWQKAGIITSNSNTLMLGDLVGRLEENYQLKALQIESEYVITQVPADYYELDGRDVGFYRDENYDFYIVPVYNTGEMGDRYHIPGPRATAEDLGAASGKDVYEFDQKLGMCDTHTKVPNWKAKNMAGKMIPSNQEFVCGRRELGKGKMGHHQSTIRYANNPLMFGDLADTPQLFHKTPDECKVPRYSVIDGKEYINIIGVRFKNIPSFNDPDIIGYKIIRSDRKGGNGTVVARGLMTNVRSYFDPSIDQTIYYSNYTVNDLRPDSYISSTQTVYKNGGEHNFTPLTDYFNDKFNFYSPHSLFEPRYTIGPELKIECEEVADVTGRFEIVYKHPREKLMNQFSFWIAAAVGFVETALILLGKTNYTAERTTKVTNLLTTGLIQGSINSIPPAALTNYNNSVSKEFRIESVADLVGLNIVEFIQKNIAAGNTGVLGLLSSILTLLAALAIKIPYSVLGGIKAAEDTFNIIQQFTGYTDYVYQYNAVAKFNRSVCQRDGNKRRALISDARYLSPNNSSVSGGIRFNNLLREKSVYLELNEPIAEPTVIDNSRQTATDFGVCDDINLATSSTGSAFYVTSRVVNPNQYGIIGSADPVSMHSCVLTGNTTPVLYGGDCIITRFQFQKRMRFFAQDLAASTFNDGQEYDYRKYRNIGFPRFWADFTKYDFSELLSGNSVNFAKFSRTTTSKHNLDCKAGDKKNIVRIDDAYMYLSNNCALDFFVEADYNVDFREETDKPFYSKDNTTLSEIFRADNLLFPEEFKISRAFSDLYTTEISSQQQRMDFDPNNPIPVEQPNSVIYSLPSFNTQEIDNWQYFLPANWFAFSESDYGKLTAIHRIDQDRLIFLFSKASPYLTMGRSVLQLSNQTITIGDAGIFAQDPRESVPTDNNYAASNSRYAFANTHLGRYYPSERQGRVINADTFDDITRQGVSYWCKNYMPIFLYKYFPTYKEDENPVSGVGYLMAFDSFYETCYISKRDFAPKREFIEDISWDDVNKTFMYKGNRVNLRDPRYFNDISWTLSYCPIDKAFVSWHDWHPDWVIQTDNHFITVKDNKVYKHNEATDSFCNFYGVDHPFDIEFCSSTGQIVHIPRSIEYMIEAYRYKNFGRDRFHVHHENFSTLIVSNTEQISPPLNLVYRSNNPENDIIYPKRNTDVSTMFDILFSKEENKYRINQFWDAVKDRGEFTNTEAHLFPTDESGYKQIVNPVAIDLEKPEDKRKKFRHYFNKFRLTRSVSGDLKFIIKLFNIKKLISPR